MTNQLQKPKIQRYVSPLAFALLFYLFRQLALFMNFAEPFAAEVLSPFQFFLAIIVTLPLYISLFLYPMFWLSDRITKSSNVSLLTVGLVAPVVFIIFVKIIFQDAEIKDFSLTQLYSPYFLNLILSLWASMSWILTRKSKSAEVLAVNASTSGIQSH